MIRIILIFSLVSFFSFTNKKTNPLSDYNIYHQRVIEAETLIAAENYHEALPIYEALFEGYDFIFVREYQIATQLALQIGDEKKAIEYLKEGIISGWKMKSIKRNKYLAKLRDSKDWKLIKQQYRDLHKQYKFNLNKKLRKKVKKMFSKDQWKAIGALFTFSSKGQDRYAEKRFAPHSEKQMAAFSKILKDDGYPGEQIIGNDYWMSTILSHHNSISQKYAKQDTLYPNLKPPLKDALKKGQISPYEFALIDEWYRLTKEEKRKPAYGIIEPPTKQSLLETNVLRSECYMRSIALRNKLIDIEEKSGMDFSLQEIQWIEGKIEFE